MDLNRLIRMFMQKFMRQAMNKGVRAATDYANRRSGKPAAEQTPEEREQARRMKDLADKARKTSRLGRR